MAFELRRSDGIVSNAMGNQASGMLIYDARWRMAAQIMRLDRPPFASGEQYHRTDDEVRAAFEGYIAYWGDYEIDEEAKVVLHQEVRPNVKVEDLNMEF